MNDTEFRILETLARGMGNATSISELTKKIRNDYGKGDYKNTYKTIQNFVKKRVLKFEKAGNSLITKLNFKNYLLVDLLTETELIKKINFLEKYSELQPIISELSLHIKEFEQIKSLLLLNPERNAKLNRMDMLFIIKYNDEKDIEREFKEIQKLLKYLQSKYNTKIEYLFLKNKAFLNYLKTEETNIIKNALNDKLILFRPQTFWIEIKEALDDGMQIKSYEIAKPTEISENEHIFNLERFGYNEFGNTVKYEKQIGIEYLITSILLKKKDARHVEAVPIILAKNEDKINYDLLVFLSAKYGTINTLYGILKAINAIKPMKKVAKSIGKLSKMQIDEIIIDPKEIEDKMRLYNVIK